MKQIKLLRLTGVSISDAVFELDNSNLQSVDFFNADGFDGTVTVSVEAAAQWIYFEDKLIGK